jgi:hypothetical protein
MPLAAMIHFVRNGDRWRTTYLLNMILALLNALEGGVNERTGNEPHDGDGSLESACSKLVSHLF